MVHDLDGLSKVNQEMEERYNKKSEELLVDTLVRGLNRLAKIQDKEFKLRQVLYTIDEEVLTLIYNTLIKICE